MSAASKNSKSNVKKKTSPAKNISVKKAVVKKSVSKNTTPKSITKKAVTKKAPIQKATVKKATKKATSKQAVKKAPAEKTPIKSPTVSKSQLSVKKVATKKSPNQPPSVKKSATSSSNSASNNKKTKMASTVTSPSQHKNKKMPITAKQKNITPQTDSTENVSTSTPKTFMDGPSQVRVARAVIREDILFAEEKTSPSAVHVSHVQDEVPQEVVDPGFLTNDEVFDETDLAQWQQLREQAAIHARAINLNKPEIHPDFDGVHCVECWEDIPHARLALKKVRCVDCQNDLEMKNKKNQMHISRGSDSSFEWD